MAKTRRGFQVKPKKPGLPPVLIPDDSLFNLATLQQLLGNVEPDTAKKWAARNKIPAIKGRSWIFSGRIAHAAVERELQAVSEKGTTSLR